MVNSTSPTYPINDDCKRIAVYTMGVKLPGETRGYTRFRKIAEMLVQAGFEVDLITSSFQHWEKVQRDTSLSQYQSASYKIVFIDEPGYNKNIDMRRIASHRQAARNLASYFEEHAGRYQLIYAEIPPNDVALVCAEAAQAESIPFVADINDLWPEAMRMVVDIPVLSDLAFAPFARDAGQVYKMLNAAVGTSDEYALRPARDRSEPYEHITVYVGNDLTEYDAGVAAFAGEIEKPANELWVAYAGMLGASYDLKTLIAAVSACAESVPGLKLKIMGDGPDRAKLEKLAFDLGAPVDFLGYLDYAHMAAWLSHCDITVNSLVATAAQSIVTKIGDYLAAGIPLINTGSSPEFRSKVEKDGFGVNVPAEDVEALAAAICELASNEEARKLMGSKARAVAETEFDQNSSYQRIVALVQSLV